MSGGGHGRCSLRAGWIGPHEDLAVHRDGASVAAAHTGRGTTHVTTGAEVTNPSAATGMRRLESGDHTLKRPVRALTADERADLLAKIDADERAVSRDLPDLFRFLMATGCRIGEALAVRWCDVNLDRAT